MSESPDAPANDAPAPVAVAPAPAPAPVVAAPAPAPAPAPAAPTFEDAAMAVAKAVSTLKAKPWHQSLTVQGALVAGVAGAVIAYGAPIMAAAGINPDAAKELAKDAAGIFASVGALMSVIGRLRLGGLN